MVVLEPDERDRAPVEEHVGKPRVLVPGLADRAHVDDRARGVEAEVVGPVLTGVTARHEIRAVGEEDRGQVTVPDEAHVAVHRSEELAHLALVLDVARDDVLADRIAGRAVREHRNLVALERLEVAEVVPVRVCAGGVAADLLPRPLDRSARLGIEVLGGEEQRLLVVPLQAEPGEQRLSVRPRLGRRGHAARHHRV